MSLDQRTERNLDTLLRPVATLPGGRVMRPLAAGPVTLARKLGLKLFTGTAAERKALQGDDLELEIYAVCYLLIEEPGQCWRATRQGWEVFREQYLLPWVFELPVACLQSMVEEVGRSLAELAASVIEPEPKREPTAPETAPPNT